MADFKQLNATDLTSSDEENLYFMYLLKHIIINGYCSSKSFSLFEAYGPNSSEEITKLFTVDIDFKMVGESQRNLNWNWDQKKNSGIENKGQIYNFWNYVLQLMLKENWVILNNDYTQNEFNKVLRECIGKTVSLEMKNKASLSKFEEGINEQIAEIKLVEDKISIKQTDTPNIIGLTDNLLNSEFAL